MTLHCLVKRHHDLFFQEEDPRDLFSPSKIQVQHKSNFHQLQHGIARPCCQTPRQDGNNPLRFKMKERMFSIGDDYWIEDDNDNKVFKVDGKLLRIRDTFDIKDNEGNVVVSIQDKMISIRDAMTIKYEGQEARIKKALIGIRERYVIDMGDGKKFKAQGNFVNHEYEIECDDGHKIGEVSKAWFRLRDTYGVEVMDQQYTSLILAITVCIDAMAHD